MKTKHKDYFLMKEKIFNFWLEKSFEFGSSLDVPIGAATMHPLTISFVKNKKPNGLIFEQVCRRPLDSFAGSSKTRLYAYEQIQVLTFETKDAYKHLKESLDLSEEQHIQFIEDNWRSPSMGAFGVGHELRVNGIEVAQLTFLHSFGGQKLEKPCLEITYGCERCFYIKHGIVFSEHVDFYKTLFKEAATKSELIAILKKAEKTKDVGARYQLFLKANHIFNLCDADGTVGRMEKNSFMIKLKALFEGIYNDY